jgi:hypothetical protein
MARTLLVQPWLIPIACNSWRGRRRRCDIGATSPSHHRGKGRAAPIRTEAEVIALFLLLFLLADGRPRATPPTPGIQNEMVCLHSESRWTLRRSLDFGFPVEEVDRELRRIGQILDIQENAHEHARCRHRDER